MSFETDHAEMPARKPRVALMGEFSAGKSTLSNILLGGQAIPVQVTATTLPPVWISAGTADPVVVDYEGQETTIPLQDLAQITHREASLIRMEMEADLLELCDLIDMPGVSDPNMPAEVWLSMLDEIDCVIWCTHANQAWRQSEAAIWERVVEQTNGQNLLLITQFDKLQSDRDRRRLLSRVKRETEGLFEAVYPVSLLPAIKAGPDYELPPDGDIAQFLGHFVDNLLHPVLCGEKSGIDWGTAPELPQGEAWRNSARSRPEPAEYAASVHATEAGEQPEATVLAEETVEARESSSPFAGDAGFAPGMTQDAPVDAAPSASVMPRRVAVPKSRRARPAKDETIHG